MYLYQLDYYSLLMFFIIIFITHDLIILSATSDLLTAYLMYY